MVSHQEKKKIKLKVSMLLNKLFLQRIVAFLVLKIHLFSVHGFVNNSHNCGHHSCGSIINITYPFRLEGDPPYCGNPNYKLSCENNQTILSADFGQFLVKAINYNNSTIRIVDRGVQDGNCSSRPINSLTPYSSLSRFFEIVKFANLDVIAYISCETPKKSAYIETAPCIGETGLSKRRYHYVIPGDTKYLDLGISCAVDLITFATLLREDRKSNFSYMDIHKELVYGLEVSYAPWSFVCGTRRETFEALRHFRDFHVEDCYLECTFLCKLLLWVDTPVLWYVYGHRGRYTIALAAFLVARLLFGYLCLIALVFRKWRKRHLSMDDSLEEFLQAQNNLMPIRYSHSEIKKMSKGFQEKVGEGGYGNVYKGKLRSGGLVAIKMLGKSNANGQDFINEVATIGRIHHVNVVRLVGFYANGPKRALVYEFMPKGSLDKYILSRGDILLSWKKKYEISLGVARGIEYLHRGCDMQILHFDIKPHNILLDENFVPKISDFGLAKLYSTDDSIVSVTAAKGTIGYIAPELVYRNIGGVSHKADVYSFGMLLMEMLGKRKKLDVTTDNSSSQIYFPLWVYHEIVQGKIIEDDAIEEEDENIIKKMTIVGLWCIQIRPCDRPSMRKAIRMLEGEVENLKLPPEPTFNIDQVPAEDANNATNSTWSSLTSVGALESVRIVIGSN